MQVRGPRNEVRGKGHKERSSRRKAHGRMIKTEIGWERIKSG
jgi:hypothetical protein